MTITQQQRQKQIFAAEDWQVLYTAFTQVNFNAYDFNTLRSAMVTYIRLNYPEDFNDWIESSEFVAIIDLLAYLGTSLAFRMDLNTRENFLDTAQRRDSIFRLARMLSYQPQRCIASTGLLKITQAVTNQDIYDSNGTNLKNIPINWNDQNNPDWYEQFVLVLNASLDPTNQFGNPSKSGTINGIPTDLYAINNTAIPTSVVPFTTSVSGVSMQFELVNPDFAPTDATLSQLGQTGYFIERTPNPINSWYLIYQVDGNGYGSANTGFFLMFKQGTMGHSDFQLDLPVANRVIDINANGVNQTDVWVQNIDSNGLDTGDWTQVPSVNGFNVIYNSVDRGIRNIFSVITRDSNGNDQISIRFADGSFGNVPIGLLRVWYRTSNGLQYQIRPQDMTNLKFNFTYADQIGNTFSLAFNSALQYTVSNSQATETNAQVALNASQVYYTQDRMVNGEDYNLYPLQSSQALKVKAVNRTYSGHSRYLDINDPTGAYQNTNVLGDDGILYYQINLNQSVVSVNSILSSESLVTNYIQPMISGSGSLANVGIELRDFFYAYYPRQIPSNLTWKSNTSSVGNGSGSFYRGGSAASIGSGAPFGDAAAYITTGSLVKFSSSNWASVVSVVGNGIGPTGTGTLANGSGAVTLSNVVIDGDTVQAVYPSLRTTFTTDEIASISAAIDSKQTFGIRYDPLLLSWIVITNDNLSNSGTFSLAFAGNTSSTRMDSSWLIKVSYLTTSWQIQVRSQQYVFESVQEARFFFANTTKVVDPTSGNALNDSINVLGINTEPNSAAPLGTNYLWKIKNQFVYPDGYADPSSVQVTFWDSLVEGIPDNPDEFSAISAVSGNSVKLVFWQTSMTTDGYQFWQPMPMNSGQIFTSAALIPAPGSSYWNTYSVAFAADTYKFYQISNNALVDASADYKVRVGRNYLNFIWKHYAPYDQRIDPAIMNLIDIYVLTASYDTALRNWIITGGSADSQPVPPDSNQLRATFGYFEQFKMMTDQIIWHPVSYKLLFGAQANPSLQVVFKVVQTANSTLSANEVKSLVKQQIDDYFALSNWDFGQSFFFTELAAYIHYNLATVVGSVVIVPKNAQATFGDLFEISCDPDQIFISCAQVSDIQMVSSITEAQLGITSNG